MMHRTAHTLAAFHASALLLQAATSGPGTNVGKQYIPLNRLSAGGFFNIKEKFEMIGELVSSKTIFKRTCRDAFYMFIDTYSEVKLAHKSYGDFHDFIRAKAKGKDLTDERMDDVDLELMRKQLTLYHAAKSPLSSFDLRWFYWMYLAWFFVLLHGGWQAYQRKQAYKELLGSEEDMTIEQRRQKFGGSYVEDVRADVG